MEESDFETAERKTGIKKVSGSLMSSLDGQIESMLNGKIDFSTLEMDGDIPSEAEKTAENAAKRPENGKSLSENREKRGKAPSNWQESADDEAERRINEIADEFAEDVKIEVGNIREKAMMEPSLRGKWIRKYVLAKAREKRLKSGIEVLREEIAKMYSSGGSFLSARQTVDSAIRNDSGIKELKRELYVESQVVEALSYCKDTIYGFGYSVKNSLEAMKLDAGI